MVGYSPRVMRLGVILRLVIGGGSPKLEPILGLKPFEVIGRFLTGRRRRHRSSSASVLLPAVEQPDELFHSIAAQCRHDVRRLTTVEGGPGRVEGPAGGGMIARRLE